MPATAPNYNNIKFYHSCDWILVVLGKFSIIIGLNSSGVVIYVGNKNSAFLFIASFIIYNASTVKPVLTRT